MSMCYKYKYLMMIEDHYDDQDMGAIPIASTKRRLVGWNNLSNLFLMGAKRKLGSTDVRKFSGVRWYDSLICQL